MFELALIFNKELTISKIMTVIITSLLGKEG